MRIHTFTGRVLGLTALTACAAAQPAERLPKDGPSLTVKGIRFHDQVLDATAQQDGTFAVALAQPQPGATIK